MRGFFAVFAREVAERRLLLAASLLLGLVPLAAPWLPGLGQLGDPELRSATALALALCFSSGLALILGTTIIARDLAEGRLGFYFSRPLRGWAIWAGKLAAAAVLALGAGVLILLPAAMVERRLDLGGGWWDAHSALAGAATSIPLWIAWVLLLMLWGHAAGVVARSRSPWLLLDFVGLGLVVWLAWVALRRLDFAGALGPSALATIGLLAAALLALTAGGAAQVLKGRTDIRRGHRLLSLTLWGTLLAAGLAAQGYAFWVLAVEPGDLKVVDLTAAARRGSWIAILGAARNRPGYEPGFLLDTASGRFARLKTWVRSYWNPPLFSADGRWAVWLEAQNGASSGPYELLRLDLRAPRPRPERTRISYSRLPDRLALSADGSRVAVAAGRRLTVEEVPSGRLLATAELPRVLGRYEDSLLLPDPGRVRIYGSDLFSDADPALRWAFEAGEMRLAGGGVVRTARIEQAEDLDVSPDGARILARRRSDGRFVVYDASTGAEVAELPPGGEQPRGAFLADGRIAVVSGWGSKELMIFSPSFLPERTFNFKTAKALRLGGQPAPDRLVVATAPRGPETAMWNIGRALVLDLRTGSMRRVGRGLIPLAHPGTSPESIASRLFLNHQGQLVQLDLETGRERVVAGRRAG